MSAVEIVQTNGNKVGSVRKGSAGEPTEVEATFCGADSNPEDSLEDIPSALTSSEGLPVSKSDAFFDRMSRSARAAGGAGNVATAKGSPAKTASPSASAIRRAASVTGAACEDFRQYVGHMSPTISSRRRCNSNNNSNSDTSSLVLVSRRKSTKEKEKDSISLPCTMTRPTPRENRACRKRIELSHRNHLDFPHEHYVDQVPDLHHHHHHHHHHSHPHSHGHSQHGKHESGQAGGPAHGHSNGHSSNAGSSTTSSGSSGGVGSAGGGGGRGDGVHLNNAASNVSHSHAHTQSSSVSSGAAATGSGVSSSGVRGGHGYASEVSAEEYLTPLQRKDQVIRGLKEELKRTQKKVGDLTVTMEKGREEAARLQLLIDEKEVEIEKVKEEKNQEIGRIQEKVLNTMQERSVDEQQLRDKIVELNELIEDRDKRAECLLGEKRHEILELREKVEELEFNYDELVHMFEEAEATNKALEKELSILKEELEKREEEHQDMYLAMFQKGKQCHNFERQEELENLGRSGANQVMVDELIEKLEHTESKLGRWQTIKTCETYTDATNRPESEADARLRFLRDSLFHYIMDAQNAMQHLRAMAGIVDFTHAQREQVDRVLAAREKGVVKGVKDKLSEKKKVVQFVFKEKREEVLDRLREHRARRNSHH